MYCTVQAVCTEEISSYAFSTFVKNSKPVQVVVECTCASTTTDASADLNFVPSAFCVKRCASDSYNCTLAATVE